MDIQTPLARAMVAASVNDAQLGKRIGCSSQHVNRCRRGIKSLSPQMAQAVVREIGGVTLHELLPDVYPAESAAA